MKKSKKALGFRNLKEDQELINKGFPPGREHRDHEWSKSSNPYGVAVIYRDREDVRLFDCRSVESYTATFIYKCNEGIPSKGEIILAIFEIEKPGKGIINRLAEQRPGRRMDDYNGAI